ncbi:hypothetical protein LTR37_010897 [Vermiconidia calcicola]|uniref:Uncharacterized protein n=1 Tax=Vermiconidia calcicola TaxID=1690605 RepID=A0ACC3N462_9PEZI|nr:hypothetical protein LTR37_010897 [Vermiconidia calcicola]
MTPNNLPPLVLADDTHQRAFIIIATSILLFSALLFVGARLWVRQNPELEQTGGGRTASIADRTPLGFDDLLLVISTALYGVHSVLIFSACAHGLGNSVRSMSPAELATAEKLYYASNIFYVLSLGSSKASISYLMVRINASRPPTVRRWLNGILYLVCLWTVGMFVWAIFACTVNSVWKLSTEQCPNWYTRWFVLGVGGCCFEVAVAGLAVWNVWNLNTAFSRKALVVALFAMRLPLVLLVAVQLSVFDSTLFNADPTLHIKTFICATELILCYSICSANFPAFRRLTNEIRTDFGGFGIGALNTFHSSHKSNRSNSGYMRSNRSGNGQELDTLPTTSTAGLGREMRGRSMRSHPHGFTGGQESGYVVEVRNGNRDDESVASHPASEHESTEMIIRTKTEVVVSSDK